MIPKVTPLEKLNLRRNFALAVILDDGMDKASAAVAWASAKNSSEAARAYAAIARSYGVKT